MGRGSSRDSSRDSRDSRCRSRSRSRSCSRRHSRSRSRSRSRHRSRDYWPRGSRSSGRLPRSNSKSPHSRSRSRSRYHASPRSRRDYHDHYESSSFEHHYRGWGPGAEGPAAAHEPPPGGRWNEPGWSGEVYPGGLPPWRQAAGAGHARQPSASPDRYRGRLMERPREWDDRDRAWDDERAGDSSRGRSSGRSRGGSDTDRDWEVEREVEWARRFRGPETPTASVFVKGLPEDADESDVHQLFAAFPNLQSVKVLRDRLTGSSRGMAFVDFATADDARRLMESEQRWSMTAAGGQRLLLDYSHGAPGSRAGEAGGMQQAQDWVCDMCSAVNFARRLECYHCYTARPANPRRVTADLNEPSHILKVSGLEPSTSEEVLYQFCAAVVPSIVDLRVIKDKYTGAPRGFAFVELASIAEAGTLMVACQGQVLPGQSTPLKICYAKAKDTLLGAAAPGEVARGADGTAAGAAPTAAAAAADPATAGPLGWKPKEFDPSALLDGSSQQRQPSIGGSAGAAAAATSGAVEQQAAAPAAVAPPAAAAAAAEPAAAAAGPGPSSESAAAAAAAGVDAATIQALTEAGFEYQSSSGYWYDAKSGYYYDANTQLYYHHSTSQWYRYDHNTGQYTAVGAEQQQHAGPEQQQWQAQQQAQAQVEAQQQPQPQPRQAAAAEKRRRAVIGSAPQYNPEGLLAAAALAKERDDEQKRLAAAKAARERQQEQQNKHAQKQQLMPGKPGIGALPGTGSAPLPAAQVVAAGPVQGVVYKSKWAAQRAAQHQG